MPSNVLIDFDPKNAALMPASNTAGSYGSYGVGVYGAAYAQQQYQQYLATNLATAAAYTATTATNQFVGELIIIMFEINFNKLSPTINGGGG